MVKSSKQVNKESINTFCPFIINICRSYALVSQFKTIISFLYEKVKKNLFDLSISSKDRENDLSLNLKHIIITYHT